VDRQLAFIIHQIKSGLATVISCSVRTPLDPQFFKGRYKGVSCGTISTSGVEAPSTVDAFFARYDQRELNAEPLMLAVSMLHFYHLLFMM
jgi:hypothetical protein